MLACHAIHLEGHVMIMGGGGVKFVGTLTVTPCDLSQKNVCVETMSCFYYHCFSSRFAS